MKQILKILIEASKEDNKILLTVEVDKDKFNEYIAPLLKIGATAINNIPFPKQPEETKPEEKPEKST